MIIDNVECNEHGVPVGGFKVGDVVDWMGVDGVVEEITPYSRAKVRIKQTGGYTTFLTNGCYNEIHTRPSLRLVSRPRPKLEGWFNLYDNAIGYKTKEDALNMVSEDCCYMRTVYMRECDPPDAKEDGQ